MHNMLSRQIQHLKLWIVFLISGTVSPVITLTNPCQQSLIDQCGRLITGFTPQKYLSGLVPDSAIRDDCEAFASVRLCNEKVLRPCLAAELVTLDPFIRQANEFIMLFCENDQFRRDYAHHGQCLAVVSLDINQCIANYGATVSDIAAVSDNLAPQEVLHRSCCDGLHRLTQCSFEAAVRKCHPSSADFVKKFLYKMMKSTLQDWIARQCFEYQAQCGRDLGLEDPLSNRHNLISLPNMTQPDAGTSSSSVDDAIIASSPPPFSTMQGASSNNMETLFTGAAATGTRSSVQQQAQLTNTVPSAASHADAAPAATDTTVLSRPLLVPDGEGSSVKVNQTAEDDAPTILAAGPAGLPLPGVAPTANADPADSTAAASANAPSPKTFSIKTVPNEKSKTAKLKNTGNDLSHPLARKFLLIISTIAFLAGWY
ncbi:uncharacterized protein LOC129588145 [Paramacrobiotus metropolitanus]|uniref:uncharacterized protein LOC129588145 n=1 Tax=Paramacrobiotus metropolitanus TaxID=2943436 RepID=UPI0024456DD5|nr:uncharacterized protein LOC129588145 [Paramacrobiotus metropolitanus]XP_055338231.1 uncharacterized protein LOC129588145 [Paramacrobiotus metropolitanus]